MDTKEVIHNALEWANKRLTIQGEPITENQRNYIFMALSQQLTLHSVSSSLKTCPTCVRGVFVNRKCNNCGADELM